MYRFYYLLLLILEQFLSVCCFAQRGKDGPEVFTPGQYVINRYAILAANANVGDLSITVNDIKLLSGTTNIPNGFNPYSNDAINTGDLIFIIQVQGAVINSANGSTYGSITDYNTTGNYELKEVAEVSGNVIKFCPGLLNSYGATSTKKTMVVRVPRLSTFTVNNGATITALPWNGQVGGAAVIEIDGNASINGLINVSGQGFRGGKIGTKNSGFNVSDYATNKTENGAEKGESIAGDVTLYSSTFGGAYCKGAPANGGGGGSAHNCGGGGGSNAGIDQVLNGWNGTGIKANRTSPTNWTAAWELEAPGFSTNISPGGGRGGYSYFTNKSLDPTTVGPDNAQWQGDARRVQGGLGGRPLDYTSKKKLFYGGGGGAGDGNNKSADGGGDGGGIVFLIGYTNIGGIGSILANGGAGGDTKFEHRDAAGGGGGGGAILLLAKTSITDIKVYANGGNGGNQLGKGSSFMQVEAEGPGGGGSGGYIGSTHSTITGDVAGGRGGLSESSLIPKFEPNGATGGAKGTITNVDFINYISNSYSKLIDTTICAGQSYKLPDGTMAKESITKSFNLNSNVGCDSVITVNLKVLPGLTTTLYPVICPGQKYLLPFSSPASYVSAAGEYKNTGKSSSGCDSVVISKLVVLDTFSLKILKTICAGASHTLPDGKVVTTDGIYPVSLKSITGCDSTVITTLKVANKKEYALNEFICTGKAFKLPDGTMATTAGEYPIKYTSVDGCDSIVTFKVQILPNSTDSLTVSICKDSSYLLPNDSLVKDAGTYTVFLKALNGCDSVISVKVDVTNENNSILKMPTVFTPNSDGLNDVLKIPNIKKDQLESFSIYDRWGNMLFRTTSPDEGWDGKFKNIAMPIGVYVYIIYVKDCAKKSKLHKGTVGIVK